MANKYVPEEIILQIIARLPVKPLLRFKCVSKHWNLLISDPSFMKSRSRRILLISGNPIHAIDNNVPVNDKANLAFKLHTPFSEGEHVNVAGTVNGIVLLFIPKGHMILYDPLTRAYKKVPEPPIHYGPHTHKAYGFGYGTTPDDLKIVLISSKQRLSCDVYNLKTKSWNKSLELIGNYEFSHRAKGVFVNGFLYWNIFRVILALDVKEMVFSEIQHLHPNPSVFQLGTFKGQLCMICYGSISRENELWVMNERGRRTSFSKVCQLTSSLSGHLKLAYSHSRMSDMLYGILCFLDDGKIVMLMKNRNELMIYDMLNDSYKMVTTTRQLGVKAIEYVESYVPPSLIL